MAAMVHPQLSCDATLASKLEKLYGPRIHLSLAKGSSTFIP
jgi:hypothetical protein